VSSTLQPVPQWSASQTAVPEALPEKAANLLLRHAWKVWFWGDSIGVEGLLDASELTGNVAYENFAYGLLKGWLGREKHRGKFDYTAPGVALLRVFEKTADPALLSLAHRHAEYMRSFRKTEAGAYLRYENAAIELPPELPSGHPDFAWSAAKCAAVTDGGPCVFVDCVHFDAPFFAKLYQVSGEDQYRAEALSNILPQVELLFDKDESLFHHFWIERSKQRNGVLWGRGNGWALLGLVGTLECLPSGDPGTLKLIEVLNAQASRLRKLQDEGGGWHTVLNEPGSYVETSIAAFVVDGFSRAIQAGWLPRSDYFPVVERAFEFLIRHVNREGLLEGVSYETFPSTRAEHYRTMPRNAMVPWGQGPLLSALFARQKLGRMAIE
jgi:unsaturated rhamnogalacturonyl hydrolase